MFPSTNLPHVNLVNGLPKINRSLFNSLLVSKIRSCRTALNLPASARLHESIVKHICRLMDLAISAKLTAKQNERRKPLTPKQRPVATRNRFEPLTAPEPSRVVEFVSPDPIKPKKPKNKKKTRSTSDPNTIDDNKSDAPVPEQQATSEPETQGLNPSSLIPPVQPNNPHIKRYNRIASDIANVGSSDVSKILVFIRSFDKFVETATSAHRGQESFACFNNDLRKEFEATKAQLYSDPLLFALATDPANDSKISSCLKSDCLLVRRFAMVFNPEDLSQNNISQLRTDLESRIPVSRIMSLCINVPYDNAVIKF